jgi:hypothetical protein
MRYAAWFGALRVVSNLVLAVMLLAAGLGVHGLALAASAAAFVTCFASVAVLARIHPLVLRPAQTLARRSVLASHCRRRCQDALLHHPLDRHVVARALRQRPRSGHLWSRDVCVPAIVISTAIGQMFAPQYRSCRRSGCAR